MSYYNSKEMYTIYQNKLHKKCATDSRRYRGKSGKEKSRRLGQGEESQNHKAGRSDDYRAFRMVTKHVRDVHYGGLTGLKLSNISQQMLGMNKGAR